MCSIILFCPILTASMRRGKQTELTKEEEEESGRRQDTEVYIIDIDDKTSRRRQMRWDEDKKHAKRKVEEHRNMDVDG
jgi:hypothetical protein